LSVRAFRALFTILLFGCLLVLPRAGVFAQNEPGPNYAGEVPDDEVIAVALSAAHSAWGGDEVPYSVFAAARDAALIAREEDDWDGVSVPYSVFAAARDAALRARDAGIDLDAGMPVLGDGEGGLAAGISLGAIIRVLLTLAAVAVAIYGLVYLLKRASQGGRSTKDPFLKVLATTALGTNRGVHVVSVGSQAWLVGAAEHGVNLISEITDKEIVDAMLLEDSRKTAAAASRIPNFKSMLRKFGLPADSDSSTPENIRKRSERLKGM